MMVKGAKLLRVRFDRKVLSPEDRPHADPLSSFINAVRFFLDLTTSQKFEFCGVLKLVERNLDAAAARLAVPAVYLHSRRDLYKSTSPDPMAKKALAKDVIVKLIVGAGNASPSPPVGPALGSKGMRSIDHYYSVLTIPLV
jgi:hypothetical protein